MTYAELLIFSPSSPPSPSLFHTPFTFFPPCAVRRPLPYLFLQSHRCLKHLVLLLFPLIPARMCFPWPRSLLHSDERHKGKAAELAVFVIWWAFLHVRIHCLHLSVADSAVSSCNMQMLVICFCLGCVSLYGGQVREWDCVLMIKGNTKNVPANILPLA